MSDHLVPVKACMVCGQPGVGRSWKCAKCKNAAEHSRFDDRKNDPVHKLYGYKWTKFRATLIAHGNVTCQRILGGTDRCTKNAVIYHHLISPRINPRLVYQPSNVVGVCRAHHSDVLQDDPALYVPTVWTFGMLGETAPPDNTVIESVLRAAARHHAPMGDDRLKPGVFHVSSARYSETEKPAAPRISSIADQLKPAQPATPGRLKSWGAE